MTATPKNSEWEEKREKLWEKINAYCVSHATDYKNLKKEFDSLLQERSQDTVGEMEIRLRRDRELLIMMDEAERKGWDFNRFIKTFAVLIETKGASPSTPLQKLSEQLNQK